MGKRKDDRGRVLKTGESQRADKTYMYRYTDPNHKRHTVYAQTLQELRSKENDIITRNTLGMSTYGSSMTIADMLSKYSFLFKATRKSTQENYEYMTRLVLKYPIANKKISEFRISDAKAWMFVLYNEGRSVSSVYLVGRFMRRVFNAAIEDDFIYKNPFAFRMDILPEPRKQRQALTQDQVDSLLDFIKEQYRYRYYYDYIVVLLGTGLRIGELLGLTIRDIDFQHKCIHVNKQLRISSSNAIYIERPKSESGVRTIPMTDDTYAVLQRMVDRSKHIKINYIVDGYSGFLVFDSRDKLNHSIKFEGAIRRMIKKYNETHDVPLQDVTPHVFRHTFCTRMAALGVPPSSLQYLMGHANTSTTLDVYTHSSYKQAQQDMIIAINKEHGGVKNHTPIFTPIAR